MALLDSNGNWVVKYTYDAWGNILTTTASTTRMLNTLAKYNPLRYRGYVYDRETGLYYLQSRYYNPKIGRFINADAYISTGQNFAGNNMFAYCINNPVNMVDVAGFSPVHFSDVYITLPDTDAAKAFKYYNSFGRRNLPPYGEPNSSDVLFNPDGTPKQKRWYGPDGGAERDRDYNHDGNMEFPHDHEWKNGKRGTDHLPPSPEYEFSAEPLLGMGIITICSFAAIAVVVDDLTGAGVANDGLLAPLGAAISEGFRMIFKRKGDIICGIQLVIVKNSTSL